MARRSRLLAPGVLYHVIMRENQRQKTFLGDSDYQAYLERLGRYRSRLGVIVYANCLMSNHVHLASLGSDFYYSPIFSWKCIHIGFSVDQEAFNQRQT